MNDFQKLMFDNYVLFYADYLSLRDTYTPITDTCKYYFLMECPINAAFVVNLSPVYDIENKYYTQSYKEMKAILDKVGYEGLTTFVQDLCNLKALGVVGGDTMLKCILMYDDKKVRRKALATYWEYMKSICYDQQVVNDLGDIVIQKCSKYVYHVNQNKKYDN